MSAPAATLLTSIRLLAQPKGIFRTGTQKRARAEQRVRELAASLIGFRAS